MTENVFLAGVFVFGAVSLGSGFVTNKIVFLVFRAIVGIAASLTIPSALRLVVLLFPDPSSQARAIAGFSCSVAVGNLLGLVLGAVFVQLASYRWIFYFEAMISLPIALLCMFLVPSGLDMGVGHIRQSKRNLDWVGIALLTSESSSSGWRSVIVILPLCLVPVIAVVFVLWERRIPSQNAAIPSSVWSHPNVPILCGVSLMPMLWWTVVFYVFGTLWQEVYFWSALRSAVHLLPIGIGGVLVMMSADRFSHYLHPKWVISIGYLFLLIATALLAFADRAERYWSFAFPAFCVGTAGAGTILIQTKCVANNYWSGAYPLIIDSYSIAILRCTPPAVSGTVGAIWNTALQLGSAVGISAVTALQSNIDEAHQGPLGFRGRADGFWLLFALAGVATLVLLLFYRTDEQTEDRISIMPSVEEAETKEIP
ncbi:MFS general substrate transporter [Gloeophyllum trabeum ATCC 11539]|uniref:MFS general substrate transporter n=1 Tax=Gloeophyllum trabeum (strain ATCC 11539 / FP-39264 / Madison 617) TaxID=670483 RepID=S7QA95_GLOTA|nr:MFS general substrate transporter [Gloeophyllum trabeum ATCC 11539]EPQ56836.1 MFS general substrate transporter [Gloeophyllum trabeum ATCC 11539]